MANRNKKTQKKYEKSKGSEKTYQNSKRTSNSKRRDEVEYDERKVKDDDKKSWNDASWYIPDEKIRQQVGTYAVNTTTGIPQYIDCASGEQPAIGGKWAISYGSIMSIKTFPYPGTGTSLTASVNGVSALDTACRKLYTAISSVNSKTTQYTPESLGIAIIALGELISLISFATRLYGVAFTYNPRNRQVPSRIIEAMGISDGILDDLAHFRMQLNKLITASNNVRMLKDLKYFTKCWELYANYYEDTSSGLAQYYITRPAGYLQYVETSPTTGELQWVDFGNSLMSYTTLIQHIQSCINTLLTSSLMNYVYTDIVNYVLKEGGELLGFSYIGELYSVLPKEDVTFLTQVHNMTWGMFNLTGYKIYEDPNTLEIETTDIFNSLGSKNERQAMACDRVVDFPFTDNPSVDDKIDAVMFQTIVWDIDANGKPLDIAAPDHPVLGVEILDNANNKTDMPGLYDTSTIITQVCMEYNYLMQPFSISPLMYYWYFSGSLSQVIVRPVGELNYFTVMKYKQLKNIFDFAFLGLFDAEVKEVHPY